MTAAVVGVLVAGLVVSPLVGVRRGAVVRRRVEAGTARATASADAPPRAPVATSAAAARALGSAVRRALRRPPDATADLVVGAASVLGPALAVVAGPFVAVVVVAGLWIVPRWCRRHRARLRRGAVRAVLPDVVDLFRLAVGAGLSVHQTIDVVAPRAAEPFGSALDGVRRQVALGVRLGDALDEVGDVGDLGDEARPLVAALVGAARYGSPLGPALERVAVDARLLRRRRAEERARKLPVQLLFPLVMCVLPAFGLLAVVPLLAGSLPSLGSL